MKCFSHMNASECIARWRGGQEGEGVEGGEGRPLKVFVCVCVCLFDGNEIVVVVVAASRKMWEIHGSNFSLLKALKVSVSQVAIENAA